MKIHETLQRLRLESGLTQAQVAERLNLTRQAVSSYESGRTRPDVETLMALAEIYGTDLDEVLYGQSRRLQSLRRITGTAKVTLVLLPLLTAVSSTLLWAANRFFPLEEGVLSPEELPVWEVRQTLSRAWETADALILALSLLAFFLLVVFLLTAPGRVPLKRKAGYGSLLAVLLLAVPLPFGLTDPLFPLINYLVTPLLVVGRLVVFLAAECLLEALLRRKRSP